MNKVSKRIIPGIGELRGRGEDRFLSAGTRVCLPWKDEKGTLEPEVGVVVHCWLDEKVGFHDCYVAFFGSTFPSAALPKPPYVLKYASTSLDEIIA